MFFVIILTFFALVHYLFYARVIKKLHFKPQTRRFLLAFVVFNALGVASYVLSRYIVDLPLWLYFLASLSIGVGFVFFVFWIIYEILHLFQKNVPLNAERRAFFKKSSDVGFVSLGTLYVGTATYEGSKDPTVAFIKHDQNLFKKPLRVVQISDMHIGGLIDYEFVKKSVETIKSLNPDIVALTGDIVDTHVTNIQKAVMLLRNIQAKHGVYFVTGNHEFFHGIDDTIAFLKNLGIDVLENENRLIQRDSDKLYIVGVHDVHGFRVKKYEPNIQKATQNIPDNSPTLLLAHQPCYVHYLQGFTPNLMLSGHTHGGQIWPFNHLVTLQQPYLKGLYEMKQNSYIYVNTGIGFWGPPMRLGTSAEITCIDWS
jgi:hypothetical protein